VIGRTNDPKCYSGFLRAGGSGESACLRSSSQAQGLRSIPYYIKVTRDESQVSVGGLLALDQVLEKLGHV
jgi:hypothetical protein